MSRSHNQITYFWHLLTWVVLLAFTIIVYHFIDASGLFRFDPATWTLIDNIYKVVRGLLITSLISTIVSMIIREIKYGLAGENLVMRKFLPTLRFTLLLIIWIVGIFLILENLKVDTTKLLTGAGIGGAIFALASRDIIANLLGSLSLILSKTFEIGDTIRIRGVEGIVEEITLNYTKIMDIEGKVIYIPNRTLNTESLENLTRRRFYLYTYKVPMKKTLGNPDKIRDVLMLIEGKISEYSPIGIEISTEIPNANDFVYVFAVKVPEENEQFNREIREFLIPYIFPKEEKS